MNRPCRWHQARSRHAQRLLWSIGFWWLVAGASPAAAEWLSESRSQMGTRVHVELFHPNQAEGEAVLAAVFATMERIEAMMSPYRSASDLSRLNRNGGAGPVAVPRPLFDVVARAQAVSRLTAGAFDVTFASVGHRYDYRVGIAPAPAEIESALPGIDYRHLLLDDDTQSIGFARAGVVVDLGGIAKGYAVDRAIDLLVAAGVQHAMVAAGGDSRLLGDRRGQPWIVGVRNPRATGAARDAYAAVLPLADVAVSTSGDYERYFERDGVRYHHILDPKTGDSARAVQSVTIIGAEAMWTDALSTSVFVLGVARGLALIESLEAVDAIIVDGQGRLHFSSKLAHAFDSAAASRG